MSTRLVILGLLRERPLYGYEIKQIIGEHMSDWTSIGVGSIYFAIDKLAEEGFIEKTGVEQTGNRPSRSVYTLKEEGRVEFSRLLRETWRELEWPYFSLDIALFFLQALPKEEIIGYLRTRVQRLEIAWEQLETHQQDELDQPQTPVYAAAIFNHARAHLQAELSWTKDVLEKIELGVYV